MGEVFIQEHRRTIFAFSLLEVVLERFQIMKSCCAFEKAGLRAAKQSISVASIPIPEYCQWTSVALYILHMNDSGLMADGDGQHPSQQVVFVGKTGLHSRKLVEPSCFLEVRESRDQDLGP